MNIRTLTVVLIILSAAAYHFFTSPVIRDVEAIAGSYTDLRNKLETSLNAPSRDVILSEYASVSEADRNAINGVVPKHTEEEFITFLREVELISKSNGKNVKINQFNDARPTGSQEEDEFVFVVVKFNVEAEYPDIREFFGDLYVNNRIVFPTEISLVGDAGFGSGSNVKLWNIALGTYFRK